MNLLKIGLDVSRGIGDAHFHQTIRDGNRDANLGLNHFFSFVTQYSLLTNTLSKVHEVLQNIQFATIPPVLSSLRYPIALGIPLSITLAKQAINSTNSPNLHAVITTLDNQVLPSVILVTNLVAAVALITFGNPVYGSVNLSFLLLHLIHENGWMDTNFIQKNEILHCILDMCVLTSYAHSLLIDHSVNPYYIWVIGDKLCQAINYARKPTDVTIVPLALQEYKSKHPESSPIPYRLDEYHLLKDPISSRPLEDLTSQFDQYTSLLKEYLKQDFSNYILDLLRKFGTDDNWIQNYNNNPIDYLNNGINGFINTIRVSHNAEIKNKSLSIIRYIFTLPKAEQLDLVTDLAIIGHYCPERFYNDTKLLYDTYIDTLESRDLSNKIIGILHQERLQIIDQMLACITDTKLLLNSTQESNASESTKLFDLLSKIISSIIPPVDDIHFANSIKNILDPYLYAHHKSIDTLTKVDTEGLEWLAVNWFYKKNGLIPRIESNFLQQYNPEFVLKRISNIIEKEPTIPAIEIEQWFIEQYMSSHSEATRNEATEWLHTQVYAMDDDYIPRIKPYYILFFLVNQGVLKLENNPNLDTTPQRAIDVISSLSPTQ